MSDSIRMDALREILSNIVIEFSGKEFTTEELMDKFKGDYANMASPDKLPVPQKCESILLDTLPQAPIGVPFIDHQGMKKLRIDVGSRGVVWKSLYENEGYCTQIMKKDIEYNMACQKKYRDREQSALSSRKLIEEQALSREESEKRYKDHLMKWYKLK